NQAAENDPGGEVAVVPEFGSPVAPGRRQARVPNGSRLPSSADSGRPVLHDASMDRDPSPPSPWAPRAPSRDDINEKFEALLAGSISRSDADRWAAQWASAAGDPGIEDDV